MISPYMATKLLKKFRSKKQFVSGVDDQSSLTRREKETLSLLSKGSSSKDIAAAQTISESTAKNHVHNILQRLALHSRTEAAGLVTQLYKS